MRRASVLRFEEALELSESAADHGRVGCATGDAGSALPVADRSLWLDCILLMGWSGRAPDPSAIRLSRC